MSDAAFVLFWDTANVGDEGVTAELVPFPGSGDVMGWKHSRPIEVPRRIYFEANLRLVRQSDYPDNDVGWPIMSERMRSLLLTTEAPRHRVIPVTMLDDTVPSKKRFDGDEPRPGAAIEGFAALQILDRTDAMDMERSEYQPDDLLPGRAVSVRKLVLKDTALPPVFRLSAYPSPLLVSRAAREQLERAGIRGIQFWSLDRVL